jgi:putative endopeptidase
MLKKQQLLRTFCLIPLSLLLVSINATAAQRTAENPSFNHTDLDPSCTACRDFYQFATGGWRARHPIPADNLYWDSFVATQANVTQAIQRMIQGAANQKKAILDSNQQKIGDFYASCVNVEAIEALGANPLLPDLVVIDHVKNRKELQTAIARLQSRGINPTFFAVDIQLDSTHGQRNLAISPGGFLLNSSDYHGEDETSRIARQQYLNYVAQLFKLVGDRPHEATAHAAIIMKVEGQLAKIALNNLQQQPETSQQSQTLGIGQLQQLTPNFSWKQYFRDLGNPNLREVNVLQPNFLKALDQALVDIPLEDWKTYLRWKLILFRSAWLSSPFTKATKQFVTRYLNLRRVQQGNLVTPSPDAQPKTPLSGAAVSRPQQCQAILQVHFQEPISAAYVQQFVSPKTLTRVTEIAQHVRRVLREKIRTLDWMSAATRTKAIAKLDAVRYKIGYPEHRTDFSTLKLERGQFALNFVNIVEFLFKHNLQKIGKPLDDEWLIPSQSVLIQYFPTRNEIIVPAGILQPPFFSLEADDALNYGAIGTSISHELFHSIFTPGGLFNGQGQSEDWWAEIDKQRYQERLKCITEQAASFNLSGLAVVNSEQTLDENAADLASLSIAYTAFQENLQKTTKSKQIDGFTPEQRFFLNYARIWASNYHLYYLTMSTLMETHALAPFRVNGPLANLSEFTTAFGCRQTDAMVRPPQKQCRIL